MGEKLYTRKEEILRCIISSFMRSPEPVGSKKFLSTSGMTVSSATIRNEMSELEHLGYIAHPHTSAGRVPTDKGYRYYVDHLVADRTVAHEQKIMTMIDGLKNEIHSVDQFFEAVSSIVSVFARHVGVVVLPAIDDLYFRSVNLVTISDKKILVVWTTMSGLVQEQIILLDEPMAKDILEKMANFMNSEFTGMAFHAMDEALLRKRSDARDSFGRLIDQARAIVRDSMNMRQQKHVWVEGVTRFLDEPEFQDVGKVKPLFEALQNEDKVAKVFTSNAPLSNIQVTIGQENPDEYLWNCSIIKKNFYINDALNGTISVLGPRRMNYDDIFTILNGVADVVTDVFRANRYM